MSLVYITNASFRMISKSLKDKKTKLSRNDLLEDILSDFENESEFDSFLENFKDFFNTNELKEFYFEKMVLKNFAKLLEEIAGNKDVIAELVNKSNNMYVHQIKTPAFHLNQNCQWMKSDFKNIILPANWISNDQTKKRAVEWLHNNQHFSFEELNSKFKIEFQCEYDLEEINRSNSGTTAYDNVQINKDIYSQTKKSFRQMRMFFDGNFAKKVQDLKYAASYSLKNILKNNTSEPYYNTIIDFHTMKETTKQMITKYYQNKYNINLAFNQSLLESIGFRNCKACN